MSTSEGSRQSLMRCLDIRSRSERALPLPVFEVNYFATQDWADPQVMSHELLVTWRCLAYKGFFETGRALSQDHIAGRTTETRKWLT
jgi:hypothetical protein